MTGPLPAGPERADEPGRLARWAPPAMILLMLGTAALLLAPVLTRDRAPVESPTVPVLALLAGFVAFEVVILHVPLGRDLEHGQELNLTEVVLVVGLFLSTPLSLMVATVGAVVVVNLVRRTQPPLKQLFNASSRFLDVGTALLVFEALVPADPLSPGGWLAGTAAGVAAGFASSAVVTVVIRCVAGPMPLRELLGSAVSSVPLSVMCAAVAYVGVVGLHAEGSATAPVVLAIGSLLLVLRITTVLGERHLHLAELHEFGRRVAAASDVDTLMTTTLATVTELVFARRVTAYVAFGGGGGAVAYRTGPGGELDVDHGADPARVPARRGLVRRRTGLVSAAPLGDGGELVLVVTGRGHGMGLFRREDVRVLDLVAHRAASDLHTLLLVERLRAEAFLDPLTGLPNRRAAVDALRGHDLAAGPAVVVWLGLRGMREVNAALGHELGNELLREVGRRLTGACGTGVLVARTGGSEFAVILDPGPTTPAAQRAEAARLLAELGAPFQVADIPVLVQGLAGIAEVRAGRAVPAEDALRRADIAMRSAISGGQPTARYTAAMETSTPALLRLASELRAGITEGQLVLHAQPQQRLGDGGTFGVELLVRWAHPRLGLLGPDQFLPLAMSTGQDRPLTAWVVKTAIAALAAWRRLGLDLHVSINVVPAMITDGSILALLEEQLALHRAPADRITIEVVESGLIDNPDRAADVLRQVTTLGVRISIDDFGTGFSSLSHLRRLPVQEIKIDLSFVRTMLTDHDDAVIVTALIGMGHNLGLSVVAEGIESVAILDRLRHLGCDAGQGFHLARPMPLDELPGWMEDHRSEPVAAVIDR